MNRGGTSRFRQGRSPCGGALCKLADIKYGKLLHELHITNIEQVCSSLLAERVLARSELDTCSEVSQCGRALI